MHVIVISSVSCFNWKVYRHKASNIFYRRSNEIELLLDQIDMKEDKQR